MEKAPVIKRVTARNFWGQGDLVWDLNPDVNVLVGKNGTGKTTLLRAISETLARTDRKVEKSEVFYPFDTFEVELTNGTVYRVESSEGQNGNSSEDGGDYERFVSGESYQWLFAPPFISTFDSHTTPDDLLEDLIEKKFPLYQRDALQLLIDKSPEASKLLDTQIRFQQLVDERFSHTHKTLDAKELKFRKGATLIDSKALSSGEKQLLSLLLSTLFQREEPTICLLDEPEISLHIDWQEALIQDLRNLNPAVQLIIVTHSATTFFPHWRTYLQRIEELLILPQTAFQQAQIEIPKNNWDVILEKKLNTTFYFNQQLKLYPRLSIQDVRQFIAFLKNRELRPDIYTMNMLAERLSSYQEALTFVEELAKEQEISPDIVSYNTLLKKCLSFQEAQKVLDAMTQSGIRPDIYTFSTLLGKATNAAEVMETEDLRTAYRITGNFRYNKKLAYKLSH